MKNGLTIIFALVFITGFAQKVDTTYTKVENVITGQDAPAGFKEGTFFMGNSFEYAVFEFTNVFREGNRNKKEQQRIDNARQQSVAKLGIIKEQYNAAEKYPDSIKNGWHNIIATDNNTFCKEAKVLVQNDRIKQFVIENYIPINFTATGSIKKAKNTITLKNFNGEQLSIMDVYFIYDLEEPNLFDPPIEPGYVCFWTDLKHYPDIMIKLNGQTMEEFKGSFETEPQCFSNGMICRIMKPGEYSFKAVGKGSIDWDSNIRVRSGECVKVKLTSRWH